MGFGKGENAEPADGYGLACAKGSHQLRVGRKPALLQGRPGDIDRQLVAARKDLEPADMIVMFMRDKNGPDPLEGETQPAHPPFRFPAGEPGIDEHGFVLVTDIITVTVAA